MDSDQIVECVPNFSEGRNPLVKFKRRIHLSHQINKEIFLFFQFISIIRLLMP